MNLNLPRKEGEVLFVCFVFLAQPLPPIRVIMKITLKSGQYSLHAIWEHECEQSGRECEAML